MKYANRLEEFVAAWQSSESAIEAAKKLGITPGSARVVASVYRVKKGIPLKKFNVGSKGYSKNEVSAAIALAKKLDEKR